MVLMNVLSHKFDCPLVLISCTSTYSNLYAHMSLPQTVQCLLRQSCEEFEKSGTKADPQGIREFKCYIYIFTPTGGWKATLHRMKLPIWESLGLLVPVGSDSAVNRPPFWTRGPGCPLTSGTFLDPGCFSATNGWFFGKMFEWSDLTPNPHIPTLVILGWYGRLGFVRWWVILVSCTHYHLKTTIFRLPLITLSSWCLHGRRLFSAKSCDLDAPSQLPREKLGGEMVRLSFSGDFSWFME